MCATYGIILVFTYHLYGREKESEIERDCAKEKVILISSLKEIDPLRDGYLGNWSK